MSNFVPESLIQAAIESGNPACFLASLFQKSVRAARPDMSEEEVFRAGINFIACISALSDLMMTAVELEDDASVAVLSSAQDGVHSFQQALANCLADLVKH